MALLLSTVVRESVEKALTENQGDANPFVREGDATFMRYDELRVIQQCAGLVDVEFRWRGTLTYTIHIDCNFAAGQLLTLTGIEGKMGMSAL